MSFYKRFDPRDLDQCQIAVISLLAEIAKHHGHPIAQRLFAETVTSKQNAREMKNVWLLIRYIRSGLSVKKFAAKLAEKNRSLTRQYRSLAGGTSAEAIEKQIRRLKKSTPPRDHIVIKSLAKDDARWGDIS